MDRAMTKRSFFAACIAVCAFSSACSAWVKPDPDRALVSLDAGFDATTVVDLGRTETGPPVDASGTMDAQSTEDAHTPSDVGTDVESQDTGVDGDPIDIGVVDTGVVDSGADAGLPLPDNCTFAREIRVSNGNATVTGRFGALNATYALACGQSTGRDAVYYVTLDNVSDVTIDTIGSDPDADAVLAVGTADGVCNIGTFNLGCHDDIGTSTHVNQDSRIWVHRVGSSSRVTRLYIVVKGYDASATGQYTLNVRVASAALDRCPSGGAQPIDVTGGGLLIGLTQSEMGTGVLAGARPLCTSPPITAPEAVARYRAFSDPAITQLEFVAIGRSFVPQLYMRSTCTASSSDLGCVFGSSTTNTASIRVSSPASGVPNYVVVDNLPNFETSYTLQIKPVP